MATVLIVDDDLAICQMLCELVEELGHTALSALNGHAALAVAKAHRPDLILSDVMMPVLDGYGLVHALRTEAELAHTTVFLMSAAFSSRRTAAIADEVTGFIEKPFDLTQIEQLLRNLSG
jgi:CheY-like chemotaxis protein